MPSASSEETKGLWERRDLTGVGYKVHEEHETGSFSEGAYQEPIQRTFLKLVAEAWDIVPVEF